MWFYRTDCPFCEAQAPALRGLAHSSDLSVLSVSMDGLPLPSGAFPDYVVDQGQSAALGVQTTPSIFIMRPASGEVELIAQGMMELRDMQERILLVARRRGWISEEAWEATRSVRRTTVTVAPEALPTEVLDDPAALVAHLRQAMRIQP
jgi:conjugal transfer pilus assembly protein TraF